MSHEIGAFGQETAPRGPEPALSSLHHELTGMQYILWTRSARSRTQLHELLGVEGCGARMTRDGILTGSCECTAEFQDRIATTLEIVRDLILSGRFAPRDSDELQRRIWLTFKQRSWSEGPEGERRIRTYYGAVADPGAYRLTRRNPAELARRMPSRLHAEVLVAALTAGGSRRLSFDPRSRAFEAYLAEKVTEAGVGDFADNLARIHDVLREVRELSDEQARWKVPCCGVLLPWFEARVEHALAEHFAPGVVSRDAQAEADGPVDEPTDESDLVEPQVIADEAVGALEPGFRDARGLVAVPENPLVLGLLGAFLRACRAGSGARSATLAALAEVAPGQTFTGRVLDGIAGDLVSLAREYGFSAQSA